MRLSDWRSNVCSSDLKLLLRHRLRGGIALRLTARGPGRDQQSKCQNDRSENRPDRSRALQALHPLYPFPAYGVAGGPKPPVRQTSTVSKQIGTASSRARVG